MKPISDDEKVKLINMARKNPIKFYEKAIDSLLEIEAEDKISLYTVLILLIGYIRGTELTEEQTERNKIVIMSVLDDYEIKHVTDLQDKLYDAVHTLEQRRLIHSNPSSMVQ